MLRERYAPDRLWFCDDIFGLKARWLIPFSERIAAEGLAVPFLCQTRADLMTAENVAALRARRLRRDLDGRRVGRPDACSTRWTRA